MTRVSGCSAATAAAVRPASPAPITTTSVSRESAWSSRGVKSVAATGVVDGGLAAGGPALASMSSSSGGAPGQQAPAAGAARSTPGTGITTCQGGTLHRSVVRGGDAPLYWTGGSQYV